MKLIFKAIILQLFWFLAVFFGPAYPYAVLALSVILSVLNYIFYSPIVKKEIYIALSLAFVVFGTFHDFSLQFFGLIDYVAEDFPIWLLSLYVVFICYYGDLFNAINRLPKLVQFVLGGAGGLSAYIGGAKIAGFVILGQGFMVFVALAWGTFFVLSLKAFYALKR